MPAKRHGGTIKDNTKTKEYLWTENETSSGMSRALPGTIVGADGNRQEFYKIQNKTVAKNVYRRMTSTDERGMC